MGELLSPPLLQTTASQGKHYPNPSMPKTPLPLLERGGWAKLAKGTPPHQVPAQGGLLVPVGQMSL